MNRQPEIRNGKTKDKNWRALEEEYFARLSHFVRSETVELKDSGKEIEGNRSSMSKVSIAHAPAR